MKAPKWALTEDAFRQLLDRLDPDSELAAQKYETLRQRLIVYFEARRCALPETLADEALNRVAQKISSGELIVSLNSYSLAVAKYIFLESQRRPLTLSLEECRPEDDVNVAHKHEVQQQELEAEEVRARCMKKCLAELPEESRSLMIEYYMGSGRELATRRLLMAERLGVSPNALYIKIHRIREKLEAQLMKCLEQ